VISNDPTQNMNCSGGVCSPTAPDAVLNVGDLEAMLASGDLTVAAGGGHHTTANIIVADGFSWTNTSRLTLDAKKNLTVTAPVSVAGSGALTLDYNQDGTSSDLLFVNKGKIGFADLNSNLIINGLSFRLVGDIK